MSFEGIEQRMPTETTKKKVEKGGPEPRITSRTGNATTGYETEDSNPERERGYDVGGISKRSYSDEPQPEGLTPGRRIRDGVGDGGKIIKKGG